MVRKNTVSLFDAGYCPTPEGPDSWKEPGKIL